VICEVEVTRNKVLKANTRAYESLNAKLGILRNISRYGRSSKYLEEDQDELLEMGLDEYKNMISTYLDENQMIYLVVGDKATQWSEVSKLGREMVELDVYGNVIP